MTRVRDTLTLSHFDSGNILLDSVIEGPSIIIRSEVSLLAPSPKLLRRYIRLTPADVFLGFAGRKDLGHIVHQSISQLEIGDLLELHKNGDRWEMLDKNGHSVAVLSRKFSPPDGMKCIDARVLAIVIRQKDDEGLDYQDKVRSEKWGAFCLS